MTAAGSPFDPAMVTAGLVVLACILLLVGAAGWLAARNADERRLAARMDRLQRDGARYVPSSEPSVLSMDGMLRWLGGLLGNTAILPEKDRRELERAVAAAGYRPGNVVPLVIGTKIVLLVALPLLVYGLTVLAGAQFSTRVTLSAFGLVVGLLGPNWALGWMQRRYMKQVRMGLADTLDLMVICSEAGLGLESMVERVAAEMAPSNRAIASEFQTLSNELRLLSDRRQALVNLGERTDMAGLRRVGATLAQTIQYGTPLGQALRSLAAEMRNERLVEFEERAARLPALLVLPLTLFILPCLVLLLAGPSFVQLIESFNR
ncbi:tight adherence protein C [Stella humosa]|uniref:Tight adherence protein C n=1 Tax=Stella humosa TaxID=94 RepID=A0A3N1MEL4_9PROT|nr:type II secretion system F family protein [Stella humosa]ROQ01160.1 tight adherence protein C [Stella humosa]BBK31535.1 pilus assembly protein TadC [Stella humosa]